jgi:hypothetical protein
MVMLALCGLSRTSFAQSPKHDRIKAAIAGSPAVWLEGNRRPIFRPENDLGPAPDSLRLENITLTFKPTAEQQADLAALLEQQQDKSSPNYHRWLTPEQYADNFGLSAPDVAQVSAWLQSQGFTVTQTAHSRLWVSFSGTAAQVRSAFQTEIHNYALEGKTYYGPASEPAVPAVLADVVQGFTALDNYGPKPHSVFRQVDAGTNPEFTSYISGNTFVAPADFAIIYDVNALYHLATPIDGTGQSIAVMGQTDLYNGGSDIAAFRSASGLPASTPTVKLVPGVTDPGVVNGDIGEASLDVEWSGAVAPKATIYFVNGGSAGVFTQALKYAVDNNLAPVISISYGQCEQEWVPSDRNSVEFFASEASGQGQAIVVAAGDSGAADCDNNTTGTTVVTTATQGYAVDFPASSPLVTAMGGAEFNEGTGTYWLPAPNSGGLDVSPSALSYIPEMVWNDTSSTLGLAAGGGGASIYYSKPGWQVGVTINDNARDVPDLSLNASNQHDGYLTCIQGNCVNGFRYTDNTLTVSGGTSAAAPTFAAIVALIDQYTKTNQVNINSELYTLAASAPAAFHDITTGNNIVPCAEGSTDCPPSAPFQIGYNAGVGYDLASGLGSVDAYNLAVAWNSSTAGNLPAPALTAPSNGATGVALSPTFSWTQVTPNAGYLVMIATSPAALPTNPATSTCNGCTLLAYAPTNNTTTYVGSLPQGTYYWQVQAVEPASSTGVAAWSRVFSFTTTGGTLTPPALSAPANGATALTIPPAFSWLSVTGSGGYRVLIATTQSALPSNPAAGTCASCTISPTTSATSFTPATTSLVGGTTYYWEVQALAPSGGGQNGPWSSVFSFTTAPGDFSLGASPTSVTVAPGGGATSTLTLTSINNFSGLIAYTCAPSSSLAGVSCTVGILSGSNTLGVTITASSTANTHPLLPPKPPFDEWWWAGIALFCLLLTALHGHRVNPWLLPACYARLLGPGPVPADLSAGTRSAAEGPSSAGWWNLRRVALGAVLATLLLVSVTCGGGSNGGGGTITPQPESGTVTVTGTSSSLSHNVTISVNVS